MMGRWWPWDVRRSGPSGMGRSKRCGCAALGARAARSLASAARRLLPLPRPRLRNVPGALFRSFQIPPRWFWDRLVSKQSSKLCGYDVLRLVLGVLLLVAAGLKGYQLSTEPALVSGVGSGSLNESSWWLVGAVLAAGESQWVVVAVIEFELLLGLCLLANVWPKATWAVTLACFGVFACVSLLKAFLGHATCGCFGRVPVNPWYTTALDAAVTCSLLRWPPKGPHSQFGVAFKELAFRGVVVLSVSLVLGLAAAIAISNQNRAASSEAAEDVVGNGRIVVLKPEKWVGKRFPLFDHIAFSDDLKRGNWFVLLYHHDCPGCQEVLPKVRELVGRIDGTTAIQVAVVEMPPYGDDGDPGFAMLKPRFFGRLSDSREWFVETPLAVLVRDGRVTEARIGVQVVDLLTRFNEEGIIEASKAPVALQTGSPVALVRSSEEPSQFLTRWRPNWEGRVPAIDYSRRNRVGRSFLRT